MPAVADASFPQPVTSTTITVGGHPFLMTERPQLDDTSLQQWPAGQMLSEHIAATPDSVAGKQVLELGAGCGLAGMAAAKAGAKMVLLTDIESGLANLCNNIKANEEAGNIQRGLARAQVLEWGDEAALAALPQIDVVILSDCTYWSFLFERLLRTLRLLAAAHQAMTGCYMKTFLVHTWRREISEQPFFDELAVMFDIVIISSKGTSAGRTQLMQLTARQT